MSFKKTTNPNVSPIGKRFGFECFGTPKGTRTPDLLIRSQSLYPTELPAHKRLINALAYNSTTVSKKQAFFEKNLIIYLEAFLRGWITGKNHDLGLTIPESML